MDEDIDTGTGWLTVAGIVLGFVARSRIRSSGGSLTGEGLAMGGILVGALGIALAVIAFVLQLSLPSLLGR